MATVKLGRTKSANKLISYAEKRATVFSGVECPKEYAKAQMRATRELWGKNDGVQAHHVIQSFKPGEVTPEQANEIGRELAKKMAAGFECAIYTHTDKEHIHNHIVINSVNFENGRKFHAHGKKALDAFREASDELCKELGLSIIEEQNRPVRYTLAEKSLLEKGKESWKDRIRDAIDFIKDKVSSLDMFKEGLKENDIELNIRGNTWTYHDLQSDRKVRASKLGTKYEKEAILNELEGRIGDTQKTRTEITPEHASKHAGERVDDNRQERLRGLNTSIRGVADKQRRVAEELRRQQEERERANTKSTRPRKKNRSRDFER